MDWTAKWIKPARDMGDVCPTFSIDFTVEKSLKKATLQVTSLGVYEGILNGLRIGNFILAPGWTAYAKRLQVQSYDVTSMISKENCLNITVGKGWYRSPLAGWTETKRNKGLKNLSAGLTASLLLEYADGDKSVIETDDTWKVFESRIRFSELYDGEIYDASFNTPSIETVEVFEGPTHTLIPQEGEEIHEHERLSPMRMFTTPKGETVFDFGQEITGYIELNVTAKMGEKVSLSFAEMMDENNNFLTENYRSAKSQYIYTCKEGFQTYKPVMTFTAFRYIRINEFPGGTDNAASENFTAIAVYSDIKRTGYLSSSNPLLNKLFSNVIWGQKDNFLDVPTDCPQRDERLGWTGDAQVFARTACLNFDVEKFFTKWLHDMSAEQKEDGMVGHVIPNVIDDENGSAGWDDAATICPWEVYLAYGNKSILKSQFECMKKWVDYITANTTTPFLWTGGQHFGDWLALDAKQGRCQGASDVDFIASVYYAYSALLVVKAGKVLGINVSEYENLHKGIVDKFINTYTEYSTQTECVLAAYFKMAKNPQYAADCLAKMIKEKGHLMTGFLGTPYLLHVLSDYGYGNLAYRLLLRTEYPSWLYPITRDATTVWEHWDGIKENGELFRADMNSFNHYAYGAVTDWVYSKAAGIQALETFPGYEKVLIAPLPDKSLDWLEASIDTRHGLIRSKWVKQDDKWRFEITVPVEAVININGREHKVTPGSYMFYCNIEMD